MANYIAPKLPNRVLPMTKGTDRVFSIRRKDSDGTPRDWDCDVFIDIDIDKTAPTRVQAQVVDDLAVVRIESNIGDQCRNGMTWRAVMSQVSTGSSLETPLLVGIFERNDGK